MAIWMTECNKCGVVTPHVEDRVYGEETDIVWHCLYCGNEKRPSEPIDPNELAKPTKPPPNRPDKRELIPA